MDAKRKKSKATTRKSRESIFENVVDFTGLRSLLGNPGRNSVYRWLKSDPAFPRPFTYPGGSKLHWFTHEVVAYLEARPRRRYVEEGAEK